jgi:uncharacterized protein
MKVAGSVAVVTGASSGIGRQTAIDLAAAGATVVAVARREDRLHQLDEELRSRGTPGTYAVCDVADPVQVDSAARRVLDDHGRIDILVNNAGTPLHKSFALCTVEELERVMQVNYMGTVYWMKAVLPSMTEHRHGSIVNIASMAGAVPWTWEAGYAASKAAVIALCEATAPELRRSGIHVCWINPGLVRTEIFSEDALRHLPKGAERTWVEPGVLSAAIIDCIERERAGLTVPRYMAISAVLRHVAPRVFRAGIRRTYEGTLRHDAEETHGR